MTEWIRRLQALEGMTERAAPDVAEALRQEILSTAGAQQGPRGTPWTPGKAGQPVLRNVDSHLSVRALGDTIVAKLTGHYARHHLGAVRGKIQRKIIPTRGLPDAVGKAIQRVIAGEFKRTMQGGR